MNTYADIRPVRGGSLESGKAYHDIPGLPGPVYRPGSQARADHIAPHVSGRGLDVGCSVGGISFGLAARGNVMHGIDYDRSAVQVAQAHSDGNPTFEVVDIADAGQWTRVLAQRFDFAVWLSNWMWIAEQAGEAAARARLMTLSACIPTLVFETAEADSMASTDIKGPGDVRALLTSSTIYGTVEPIGRPDGWQSGRTVFVCRR